MEIVKEHGRNPPLIRFETTFVRARDKVDEANQGEATSSRQAIKVTWGCVGADA